MIHPAAASQPALVLVVEDEIVLGMEIEFHLSSRGYRVGGPLATCEAASAWLTRNDPDFAVLDAKLSDGFCENVAVELDRRDVPFVVCSGWLDLGDHATLRAAPRLPKPVDLERLGRLIDHAVATGEVCP